MSDISLISEVDILRQEVEELAKTPITWRHVDDLGAAMSATISNGKPIIRYKHFSQAGAAEELLHLRLG